MSIQTILRSPETTDKVIDKHISLKRKLSTLAFGITIKTFQQELDKRLGALLRVSGITIIYKPGHQSNVVNTQSLSDSFQVAVSFFDGDYTMVFHWQFPQISSVAKDQILKTVEITVDDMLYMQSQKIEYSELSGGSVNRLSSEFEASESIVSSIPEKLAHKLRNPLTAILSGLSQLYDGCKDRLTPDYLDIIEAVMKAADMQEEYLMRFVLAYGNAATRYETVDLNKCVLQVIREIRNVRGVEVTVHPCSDDIEVQTDPVLLHRLLLELIRNAIEADSSENVELYTGVTDEVTTVQITNNGVTNVDEFMNTYLQPFHSTKAGRAGLGLTIARRYTSLIGGELKFTSNNALTNATLNIPTVRYSTPEP